LLALKEFDLIFLLKFERFIIKGYHFDLFSNIIIGSRSLISI